MKTSTPDVDRSRKLMPLTPDRTNRSPVLRVRNLSKAFGGNRVLDSVSLDLHRGEVVLLRGLNGSGKTTLLNILTGHLEPDCGTIDLAANGSIDSFVFPREWWRRLIPANHFQPEHLARKGVGRTWQDVRLFPTQSLKDNIAAGAHSQLGEDPARVVFSRRAVQENERKVSAAANAILTQLGLGDRAASSADMISLGQSKRVAIARAAQTGPLLFLDEPLAGLDSHGIKDVRSMLRDLIAGGRATLVVVEHVLNIPHIIDLATSVWTLENGKLAVDNPDRCLQEHRNNDWSVARWIKRVAGCNPTMDVRTFHGGATLLTVSPEPGLVGSVALDLENLVVRRGRRLVIGEDSHGKTQGLSFGLREGQIGVLQAPNGWGKSSLLEALAGLIPVDKGVIRLDGHDVQGLPTWRRYNMGMCLMRGREHSFNDLSVRESLQLSRITEAPSELNGLIQRRVADLSGGEKQKVALACTLCRPNPRVVLLDEPLSALDVSALDSFKRWLALHRNEAVLIAEPSAAATQ